MGKLTAKQVIAYSKADPKIFSQSNYKLEKSQYGTNIYL
jgi:hypothetical protein